MIQVCFGAPLNAIGYRNVIRIYRGDDITRAMLLAQWCGGVVINSCDGVIYNARSLREEPKRIAGS